MKAVILNGNSDPDNTGFDARLEQLTRVMMEQGWETTTLPLRKMRLVQCTGCFDCWLKTPGNCVAKDEHPALLQAYLGADLAVFASPLLMGFTSGLLKRASDKLLPTLLPYIDGRSGECRHFLRYGISPRFAVVYEPEPDTSAEDLEITTELWARFARNAGSSLVGCCDLTQDVKEVAHAIARA